MGTESHSDLGANQKFCGVSVTAEDLKVISNSIHEDPDSLMELTVVRARLAEARLKRQLAMAAVRTTQLDKRFVFQNAVEQDLQGLLQGSANIRPDKLVNVLKSLDWVVSKRDELKVLSIGPRSEIEIFSLIAGGFRAENIRGLDLISYSPFVDLGDMHSMPYAEKSFDIVILGWVLAYSKDNLRAVSEVLRVLKPGGMVAVGCEYNPKSYEDLKNSAGKLKDTYPHFFSTEDILKLFEGSVSSVIFRHDIRPEMKDRVGALMTIFETKK